jgi:hypothetical protein
VKSGPEREVRIAYHRAGFESNAGHHVRTHMEAAVCDWLMRHRIAHRHGSEVFTVRIGAAGTPTVYVPDIILHDKDTSGRTILIDPFDASCPRIGSTRIISTFRKEMKKGYYVIIIAKKQQKGKVLKDSYDLLVDISDLDSLHEHLLRLLP